MIYILVRDFTYSIAFHMYFISLLCMVLAPWVMFILCHATNNRPYDCLEFSVFEE